MNTINISNLTTTNLASNWSISPDDELFALTWNEILYEGGLAASIPRLSFRWLSIFVCIIGILGNILAVSTLLRPRMRTLSTYVYLTALCISNTVTLISAIIIEIQLLIKPNQFNCYVISVAKALASTTIALSSWITVGFTADRYIMICFPFIGIHRCTRRNAIYVIIICFLFSLTYLIPQLLAQQCHPMTQLSETSEQIAWVSGLSEIGRSSAYNFAITLFFNCFLIRIIPFLVIFQLNFRLIQTLARTNSRHRQINPFEEKHNDVSHMLVIVISIYLICIMPSIPFVAFFAYDPHEFVNLSHHHRFFQILDDFTKFLMILNSALQCYLYIFFGKRFRRELASFLCCVCVKYFYMPIPQLYTNSDQDQFGPNIWNQNNTFELILEGEWSIDPRKDSVNGLEFTFHYQKRPSRLSSSSIRTAATPSELENSSNQINLSLLTRVKNRWARFLSRFK